MTLDTSGKLYVGKTVNSVNTAGTVISSVDGVRSAVSNDVSLILSRLNSDGGLATFYKDGSTVGSIGTANGYMELGSSDTGIRFYTPSDAVIPANPSTNSARDAAIDLGISSQRFKDLYLSGGVYLGGTGSNNHLYDYDEGTWTIGTYSDATGVIAGNSYGLYVKIGQLVYVQGIFQVSTNFSSNAISGLPFLPINNSVIVSSVHGNGTLAYSSSAGITQCYSSGTQLRFYNSTGSAVNPSTANDPFRFIITYRTTS
jgi:hypothetical protein